MNSSKESFGSAVKLPSIKYYKQNTEFMAPVDPVSF